MSDNKPGTDKAVEDTAADAGFEIADTEPPAEPDSTAGSATPPARAPKTTFFVAWLALFAAVFALIVFGVDRLAGENPVAESLPIDNSAVEELTAAVRNMRSAMDSLQQNVNTLNNQPATGATEVAAIERRFADRLRQFDAVSGRMSAIENSVSSLQGISTGVHNAWLLAEAEYYMQIANAQLQLAGNPQLAALALALADERILQLANPALTTVRRALAAELRSLEVMDKPDTAGAALTLASLAKIVDSLPLQQEINVADSGSDELDAELTGSSRAVASLKNALSSAVSVRRVDEAVRPFIAPEAQYFLRANLALQLQAARIAMLRGEAELFEQSLDDAASWLIEYYDAGSAQVQSALQTINEVRGSALTVEVPNISESLRLLRQFNALADASARPAVEPVVEVVIEPAIDPVIEPVIEPADENSAEPEQ